MKTILSLAILCLFATTHAQELKLLKKTGTDNPNSDSGLAQVFEGEVLDDGNLYFKASYRGWYEGIWRTDGTTEGTEKLFDEDEIGNWHHFHFLEDGILFEMADSQDKLLFYKISDQSFTDLLVAPDLFVSKIEKYGDKYMMLIKNENEIAELWVTDKTVQGTIKIGEIGAYHSSMELYVSPSGAVVYTSNSFVDFEPVFYKAQTDEIMKIVDYLAPFDSLDQIDEVFIYDNLLLIDGRKDFGFRNYIFNIETEEFYPFTNLRAVKHFMPYQEDVLVITKTQIIRLDLSDYTFVELSEDVDPFSIFYLDEDILYFAREHPDFDRELCTLNIERQTIEKLEDSNFKFGLYARFIKYKGDFYYNSSLGNSTFLYTYDFDQNKGRIIDTIAVENGNYLIANALEVVGDRLITSVYTREIGHELYYLSGTVNDNMALSFGQAIKVYPNPSNNSIRFNEIKNTPYTYFIYNSLGSCLMVGKGASKEINISNLPVGSYYGYIKQGSFTYSIRFFKP